MRLIQRPLLIAAASLAALSAGCQATAGTASTQPSAPTTQQIAADVALGQTIENAVVVGLELSGVIKSKNQADANKLQAAINAATAKYQVDLAANEPQVDALADAALAGVSGYEQTVTPAPAAP